MYWQKKRHCWLIYCMCYKTPSNFCNFVHSRKKWDSAVKVKLLLNFWQKISMNIWNCGKRISKQLKVQYTVTKNIVHAIGLNWICLLSQYYREKRTKKTSINVWTRYLLSLLLSKMSRLLATTSCARQSQTCWYNSFNSKKIMHQQFCQSSIFFLSLVNLKN